MNAKEQTWVNDVLTDDVHSRVRDIQLKEGTRVCPVCQTVMERRKRKCFNQECGVNLKAAEKELDGSEVLGSALIAPVRQNFSQVRETQLSYSVDEDSNMAHVFIDKEYAGTYDEWSDVPSNHSSNQSHSIRSSIRQSLVNGCSERSSPTSWCCSGGQEI